MSEREKEKDEEGGGVPPKAGEGDKGAKRTVGRQGSLGGFMRFILSYYYSYILYIYIYTSYMTACILDSTTQGSSPAACTMGEEDCVCEGNECK